MRDSTQIRPAQPGDAEVAAVLLSSAYTHTHVTSPLPEAHESGWIERLEHFFRQDGNRFSYQNIQVAEQSSAVVGLVLSFGGRDEARLNAAVGSWLEREAQDDEWYIDALAVLKNWSHNGQYRLNKWKRSFASDILRKNHDLVCRKETPHAL